MIRKLPNKPHFVHIVNPYTDSMSGAGVVHKSKRYITHTTLHHDHSALATFTVRQKIFIGAVIAIIVAGLWLQPLLTLTVGVATMSFLYFADIFFNIFLVAKSIMNPPEIHYTEGELASLTSDELPIYTVLCPLYKEAHVLPQFVESIEALDWPKNKLDVILLLEDDDRETISAATEMKLPYYFRTLIVPASQPQTKPKACNYGLAHARGKYLVIYDAEDIPDPAQLKKAHLAFTHLPSTITCLQAKLNYFNPKQNLLTRLFTIEYSLWFDVILPGLQQIETLIPLGGTSNHFRTADLNRFEGWDPFNVTEDCDLGVRLFKKGFKTAIIDSVTYEEANSVLGNWMRQRSRWIKGYMQTFLVHMRHPVKFFRTHARHALFFQLIVGGKIAFMLINPIMWLLTISYFVLYAKFGPAIEELFPGVIFGMAFTSLILGNFLFVYCYMIGVAKRHEWQLMKYVFVQPFYWLAVSAAAFMALWQLIVRPHYWEKTVHGLTSPRHRRPYHLPSALPALATQSLVVIPFGTLPLYGVLFVAIIVAYPYLKNFIKDFVSLFRSYRDPAPPPDSLRILIFNWRDTHHSWAGGAETYVHEIAKEWVANGHKVTLFCGNDGTSPRNQRVDGVQVIRRGGLYTVYLWACIYYVTRLRGLFDVVIDCENGIPFFTPFYVKVPRFLLIFHIHQKLFREHLAPPLKQIAQFLEGTLMPWAYRHDKVVTISPSTHDEIISLGIARKRQLTIIEPGIRHSSFVLYAKTQHPSFLYLGRLKHYKNIDIAIRAFARCHTVNTTATLTIAGTGEAKSELVQLVHHLHLEQSVRFAGHVKDGEKRYLLGSSWAAVQPSSYEGWGLTVIEANAAGTPVIAANVPGLRDAIRPNITGLLVRRRSDHEMSQAMMKLIENSSQRLLLSREAQLWAHRFRWDRSAHLFLRQVYTKLGRVQADIL